MESPERVGSVCAETALIKLMMLLGESEDLELIKTSLLRDLRGERTV